MPYLCKDPINLQPKETWKSDKENLRIKLYNNSKWHKLREGFLMTYPLCCKCGGLAEHVHHINSPFDDGLTYNERLGRLLDAFNLQAMCASCHGAEHRENQKKC